MNKIVILLLIFAIPTFANAGAITFTEAKLNADRSEKNLAPAQLNHLVETQGKLAGTAFPACINSTQSAPTNFTVVVELESNGQVKNSWLEGKSNFAKCFQKTMESNFFFNPPFVPFFTAFEYTNAP